MPETILRKDAEANLQRLITAGREVFAQRGLDGTLNQIADAAGVGVGTAYRRFSNKSELLKIILTERIAELEDILQRAAQKEDPWQGIVDYLEQSLTLQLRDRAFAELLAGRRLEDIDDAWYNERIAPRVTRLVKKAAKAGAIREDVKASDLAMIQIGLIAIARAVDDDNRCLYRRYLAITLDGLRPRKKASELPVEALGRKQLQRVLGE